MEIECGIKTIVQELKRAERKFPTFPIDPIHAAAIVVEEAGELQQAALKLTYEKGLWNDMYEEAIQVGAMALRFILNIQQMKDRPSEQVERVSGIAQQPRYVRPKRAHSKATS
jgi:hypothetical protein